MPEVAVASFTVCDRDAYRYFACQTLLMTSQSRSWTECFITTNG